MNKANNTGEWAKEALTVEELKALLEYFFNEGMRWKDCLNTSCGRWQDRGEKPAYNFENLFEGVFITKTITP